MNVVAARDVCTPAWLPEVLTTRAAECGEQLAYTFLVDGETESASYTFGDTYDRSIAVARELRARRLSGERVLLLYPPGLEFAAAFFGCLYAGAVPVPCHLPTRTRHISKLRCIWKDATPSAILTHSDVLPKLEKLFQDA